MRAVNEIPLLSAEAVKQPLVYERKVDTAVFLGASGQEPTDTERLAVAYYVQDRTSQITENISLTGVQVAEKVEDIIAFMEN